jgi:hypothetical protein
VGPNTHGKLEDAYKALAKIVDEHIIPPPDEAAARQRIVNIARSQLTAFGWQTGTTPPLPFSPRIAIRYLTDPATRARQGGAQLSIIFALAGKPAQKCLTIPPGVAASEMSESDYSLNRNKMDLENWCGYFALSVWKSAGVNMPPWDAKPFLPSTGKVHAVPAKDVKEGDVGLVEPMGGRNHHFLVTKIEGDIIRSIDGNAGPYHSTFERKYKVSNPNSSSLGPHTVLAIPGTFGLEKAYFVTPNWS